MAARLRPSHQEDVRAKIKASQLINRLTKHALANKPLLDGTQVQAIRILLGKTLPDLSAVTLSGDPNGSPITVVSGVPRAND